MTAAIALAGTPTRRRATTAHTIEIGTTETAITGTIAGTGGIGEHRERRDDRRDWRGEQPRHPQSGGNNRVIRPHILYRNAD